MFKLKHFEFLVDVGQRMIKDVTTTRDWYDEKNINLRVPTNPGGKGFLVELCLWSLFNGQLLGKKKLV